MSSTNPKAADMPNASWKCRFLKYKGSLLRTSEVFFNSCDYYTNPPRLILKKKPAFPLQIIFTCFLRVSQQTPVISLHNNKRLACTMKTVCADSEIETDSVFYSSICNNSSTQQYTQLHSKPPACFGFFGHHQGATRQKKLTNSVKIMTLLAEHAGDLLCEYIYIYIYINELLCTF